MNVIHGVNTLRRLVDGVLAARLRVMPAVALTPDVLAVPWWRVL